MNKMDSKEALELMREYKEENVVFIEDKNMMKEIYNKFKDGCGELFVQKGETDNEVCGINNQFCPNCQEIKKMRFVIFGEKSNEKI